MAMMKKSGVEKLLNEKTYPVTPADMVGSWRVRSIQIDARDGIFSYPYFRCRFRNVDGKVFLRRPPAVSVNQDLYIRMARSLWPFLADGA